MSNEYDLKKVRDRQFFAGQFLWAGWDYIGEPTPYTMFPVKTSFFGAVDTAGFPKDSYYLFQSQWTQKPMVHLLPMNWTDYRPGQTVQVRAYANEPTVELFLNGVSLGTRSFDDKTLDRRRALPRDPAVPGRRQDLHRRRLPGQLPEPERQLGQPAPDLERPVQPGRLVAVAHDAAGPRRRARRGRHRRPRLRTAGDAGPDGHPRRRQVLVLPHRAGGRRPRRRGSRTPPTRSTPRSTGAGTFAGADNGKQDDAEGYTSTDARRLQRQGALDRAGGGRARVRSPSGSRRRVFCRRPRPCTRTAPSGGGLIALAAGLRARAARARAGPAGHRRRRRRRWPDPRHPSPLECAGTSGPARDGGRPGHGRGDEHPRHGRSSPSTTSPGCRSRPASCRWGRPRPAGDRDGARHRRRHPAAPRPLVTRQAASLRPTRPFHASAA